MEGVRNVESVVKREKDEIGTESDGDECMVKCVFSTFISTLPLPDDGSHTCSHSPVKGERKKMNTTKTILFKIYRSFPSHPSLICSALSALILFHIAPTISSFHLAALTFHISPKSVSSIAAPFSILFSVSFLFCPTLHCKSYQVLSVFHIHKCSRREHSLNLHPSFPLTTNRALLNAMGFDILNDG